MTVATAALPFMQNAAKSEDNMTALDCLLHAKSRTKILTFNVCTARCSSTVVLTY